MVCLALLRRLAPKASSADTAAFVTAVLPALTRARTQHGQLAGRFYLDQRSAAAIRDAPPFELPAVRPYQPAALRKGIDDARDGHAGSMLEQVMASTTVRHADAAGNDLLQDSVRADPVAVGWARVHTGSKQPCAFCAMLISRGPVYTSERSASFAAHNGCACRPVPLFEGRERWDGDDQFGRYAGIWNDVNARRSGRNALNAFRRALAEQQ